MTMRDNMEVLVMPVTMRVSKSKIIKPGPVIPLSDSVTIFMTPDTKYDLEIMLRYPIIPWSSHVTCSFSFFHKVSVVVLQL